MNFCGPYRVREILNVRPRPQNKFRISRPLRGPRKVILRPLHEKIVYATTNAKCIILSSASFGAERSEAKNDTFCVLGT